MIVKMIVRIIGTILFFVGLLIFVVALNDLLMLAERATQRPEDGYVNWWIRAAVAAALGLGLAILGNVLRRKQT